MVRPTRRSAATPLISRPLFAEQIVVQRDELRNRLDAQWDGIAQIRARIGIEEVLFFRLPFAE